MGYHIILQVKCQILPEYIPFIRDGYLRRDNRTIEETYEEESTSTEDEEMSYSSVHEDQAEDDQSIPEPIQEPIPTPYSRLFQMWERLDIGQWFYEYDLTNDGIFTCHIEKKPYNHSRPDLWADYEEFLKHIIVPISSEIISCTIEEDDWAMRKEIYTDAQLRNIKFRLQEWIDRVEHMYEDDQIVETRVIYKRPFKKSLETDVTRMFR